MGKYHLKVVAVSEWFNAVSVKLSQVVYILKWHIEYNQDII